MNKRLFFGLLTVGGLAMASIGIYLHVHRQINQLLSYCYKIDGFTFKKLTKDQIILSLHILFKNISDIDFYVNHYNFKIYVNKTHVATVKKEIKQFIKAKGISKFDIDVDFNPKLKFNLADYIKLSMYAISQQEKFIISLEGDFEIKHSFLKVKMPLKMNFTLKQILADNENTQSCKF